MNGPLAHGWHHSTRSTVAHCFDQGYPLCQDSDPGIPLQINDHGRMVGRLCETCRAVLVARIKHAL
jgi:hypothetical protein